MRLVVQRVNSSSVSVGDKKIGEIGPGLLVLVGVGIDDEEKDAEILAQKVTKMRILSDEEGKMNLSLMDKKQKVLAISQFTLLADTRKGNRPSFIEAAKPEKAKRLYLHFIKCLKNNGLEVEEGEFGEYMKINSSLDGPVTIILDSRKNE
ncbi:D-tyrosyl-tRNA(Tyr) deacylase [Candidatus Woesebacteria bacterium]|nr:D-tyrosyl-tRNA(Tyr) deacylase [Candidatus Woesebacteria bacterium]